MIYNHFTISERVKPELAGRYRRASRDFLRSKKRSIDKFRVGRSIIQRSTNIKKRTIIGHLELDSIVSGHVKNKTCLATFVERKSSFYWAIKIPDRTTLTMHHAITKFMKFMPKNSIKTFTVDRDKDFSCYKYIE